MIGDCILVAIIAFTINFSVADIYAKEFKYSINSTQELFASGISNVFASFFFCFTGCASLSRTCVQVTSGGRTQMVSIISSILLIIVLYTITTLFYYVPKV
jgi:MFS superfamily sulfate permease-like transporter